MLLSSTTETLDTKLGTKGVIELFAKEGFDAFDMSFMTYNKDIDFIFDDEYFEYIKELKTCADNLGIVCNQAHAPFPSSFGDEKKDKKRFEQIIGAIKSASILGAKIIVVHPKQHLKYTENAELLREMNIKFYKSLVPYCEKYGIKVAAENMWQRGDGRCIDSTCSRPSEFCDYIDSVGSKWIVACLDIGHVPLVDGNLTEMIQALGSRLEALHIHDNNLKLDGHTLPLIAHINFDEVTKALSSIGYNGDFTFEMGYFFRKMPNELLPFAVKLMEQTGRYLISKINN